MFRVGFLAVLLVMSGAVLAQENAIENAIKLKSRVDSLSALANRQWLTDSLSINGWGDSLRTGVTGKASAAVSKLNHKIDSLNNLKLPTEKYQHKIDSINQKSSQLLSEINEKQQQLLGKTKLNLTQWQDKLKLNTGDLGKGLGLPTDLKIPSLNAAEFSQLSLSPELSSINKQLPFGKLDGLSQWQQKIPGMDSFSNLKDKVPGLNQVGQLKDIKNNPDKLIETAATKIDGVQELKDKVNAPGLEGTDVGKLAKDMQNPEAMKEAAVEKVKQQAIDHFAGKEQVLQQAMEQVSKYKQKYSSVGSLSEIQNLKRPPNPLKGKPFIERLVPGIAIQIHSKQYLNFDFNPFAGYKITPKFTAGLGWNQRFAMNWSTKTFMHDGRVFGPRTFVDYNLPRGFAVRIEAEWMNTLVPPFAVGGDATRKWVFSNMTGLKKDYRFFKKIKGFTIVQFDLVRLIKPNHNSPYADVVNTRFGFEFPLKEKIKQPTP